MVGFEPANPSYSVNEKTDEKKKNLKKKLLLTKEDFFVT